MDGHAAHHAQQFVARDRERRPHVEHDPVPVQAIVGTPARLYLADGRRRLEHHALEVRHLHQRAILVAHGRHIAYFDQREQALILRVLARRRLEEEDVLDRGQPLDGKPLEARDTEALADHRMQAAIEPVFVPASLVHPEREVLGAACRPVGAAASHGHHHAPKRTPERRGVEHGHQVTRRVVGGGRVFAARIHIEQHLVVVGLRVGHGGHRREDRWQVAPARMRRHDVQGAALVFVVREADTAPGHFARVALAHAAHPVEAPRQHLEHDLAQDRRRIVEASGEQAAQRQGAFDQRVNPGFAVARAGIAHHVRQVRLHLGVDRLAAALEDRLFEVAVPHVAREVGQRRELAL